MRTRPRPEPLQHARRKETRKRDAALRRHPSTLDAVAVRQAVRPRRFQAALAFRQVSVQRKRDVVLEHGRVGMEDEVTRHVWRKRKTVSDDGRQKNEIEIEIEIDRDQDRRRSNRDHDLRDRDCFSVFCRPVTLLL